MHFFPYGVLFRPGVFNGWPQPSLAVYGQNPMATELQQPVKTSTLNSYIGDLRIVPICNKVNIGEISVVHHLAQCHPLDRISIVHMYSQSPVHSRPAHSTSQPAMRLAMTRMRAHAVPLAAAGRAVMTGALVTVALAAVTLIAVSWLNVTMKAGPSCVLYHSDTVSAHLSSELSTRMAKLGIVFSPGSYVGYMPNETTYVLYGEAPLYLSVCTEDDQTQDWLKTAAALQSAFETSENVSLLLRPSTGWVHEGEDGGVPLPLPADFRKIAAFMDCVKERGVNACRIALE